MKRFYIAGLILAALALGYVSAQSLSAHIAARVDVGSTSSASDRRVRFLTSTDSAELRFDDTQDRFEPNYPIYQPALGVYSDDGANSCGTGQPCGTIFDISGSDDDNRDTFTIYNSVNDFEYMRFTTGVSAGLWIYEGGSTGATGLGNGAVTRVLTTFNPKFNFEITSDPTDQLCSAVSCQSGQACARGDYALYKEANADCDLLDVPFDCCTGATAGTCDTTGRDLLFICLLYTDNQYRMRLLDGGQSPP